VPIPRDEGYLHSRVGPRVRPGGGSPPPDIR
jgi:hypothetical protein